MAHSHIAVWIVLVLGTAAGCVRIRGEENLDDARVDPEREVATTPSPSGWANAADRLILATTVVLLATVSAAHAQESGILIADGLNGPTGVLVTPGGTVWIVDSGTGGDDVREGLDPATRRPGIIRTGETSRILRIHSDGTQDLIALLPSVMTNPTLVLGGARLTMLRGELYVTSGAWSEVNPGKRDLLHAAVVQIADGERTEVANTWDLEWEYNPDGLLRDSNPYGLTVGPDSMLWVADAAANTLLKVDPLTGALDVVAVFDGMESPLPSPNRGGALEMRSGADGRCV